MSNSSQKGNFNRQISMTHFLSHFELYVRPLCLKVSALKIHYDSFFRNVWNGHHPCLMDGYGQLPCTSSPTQNGPFLQSVLRQVDLHVFIILCTGVGLNGSSSHRLSHLHKLSCRGTRECTLPNLKYKLSGVLTLT